MAKLYERIKKVIKPVLYTGLAAIALTGCNVETSKQNQPAEERTYFDDWGFVDEVNESIRGDYPLDIELADFDGDGDFDIAVATNLEGLRVYENRINQKE